MSRYYEDEWATVWAGDCLDVMRALPAGSVDAVVTDPPYALSFMGKNWDHPATLGRGNERRGVEDAGLQTFQEWCTAWASECLRLLRPGGYLTAFGAPRTWHRLAVGVEDAGFEIRDSIAWLYGQGFPKSLDVARAMTTSGENKGLASHGVELAGQARPWQGWGTALKPAHEPILVARRPLDGTVADNVLEHGVGALNIDACRVSMSQTGAKQAGMDPESYERRPGVSLRLSTDPLPLRPVLAHEAGRWPTNVVLDDTAATELDAQSGESASRRGRPRTAAPGAGWGMRSTGAEYDDAGGASRFFPTFRWEPKAPSSERPSSGGVQHPTVKPLALMRWLIRLVTPHGGLILDPFAGSGTTIEAALLEGMHCVAVEREAQYLPLIRQRIDRAREVPMDLWGGDGS
ncbi:DNA-methyltransferase [Actinomyces gaoshouyii]|uniref:DNA-methyltransferase n=1 Tax=Actinomyces gaoshouyii TaxID=1960083 RepID=UPI0009C070D0|nr:site-specific DNA-methyltransferase [Actinomyces gaoshouyii]ARD42487.1 hypothetical protein B6G06_09165 [Actinomyces gaoshouyii]